MTAKTDGAKRRRNAKESNTENVVQNSGSKGGKSKKNGFPPLKYGPLPFFRNQRYWARFVVILCVMVIVWFSQQKEKERKFAKQRETISYRSQKLSCSPSYTAEISEFPECVPEMCGRFVSDSLVTEKEADILLNLAKESLKFGGSSGGASILDLHSGALSKDKAFVNIYQIKEAEEVFTQESLVVYKLVKAKIAYAVADKFGVDGNSIYLTHPTFFSRITNETAKTVHDEYWHSHVDKETYSSFHYTTLVYLTDFGKDFQGGRFVFVDGTAKNQTISTIEPKKGRVSGFTSGAENTHYVEKVTSGTRYAITVSFTCNKEYAISDPKLRFNELNENQS